MATWKKIITSGSAAELSSLTLDTALPVAQGGTGATTLTADGVLFGNGTSAISAVDLSSNGHIIVGGSAPAAVDGDNLAGTGLSATKGNGTLVLAVDAAQTQITSVGTLDGGAISSGFGNIDIGTSTLNAGNTTLDNFTNNSAVADSHFTGSFSGSFVGDGSNLSGVGFQIDELSNSLDKDTLATGDLFAVADINASNEEKKITFANVRDAVFGDVSSEVTIAAGGAATVADNVIDEDNLKTSVAGDGLSGGNGSALSVDLSGITNQTIGDGSGTTTIGNNLVVNNDLTVNGDLTTIATTNTLVEDQLMFLGTGSAGTNKDVGIIAQSGSTDKQGSAFYQDTTSQRWSVAKSVNNNATAITPLQFVTTVKTDTVNPDTTSGSYGAGEMHVNTSTGEIWIRFG